MKHLRKTLHHSSKRSGYSASGKRPARAGGFWARSLDLAVALSLTTGLLVTAAPVRAQNIVWTGNGGNGSAWSNTSNWSPATVPNSGSANVTFGSSPVTNTSVRLDNDYSLNSLTFASANPRSFLINSISSTGTQQDWTLHLGAGGIINNTNLQQTISSIVRLTANSTFNAATAGGTLTLAGITGINGNQYNRLYLDGYTLSVTGPGNTVIASPIITTSSSAQLNKSGTGTLTLSGANTGFNGQMSVTGGVLDYSTQNSLNNGGLTLNGGTLRYSGGSANFNENTVLGIGTNGGTIDVVNAGTTLTMLHDWTSSTGTFTKTGVGTLVFTIASTYTGPIVIDAGTLSLTRITAIGLNDITNNGNLSFTLDTSGNFSVKIAGTGSVSAVGGSALTLSNTNNSFTGGLKLSEGSTVNASVANSAGAGDVSVVGGNGADSDALFPSPGANGVKTTLNASATALSKITSFTMQGGNGGKGAASGSGGGAGASAVFNPSSTTQITGLNSLAVIGGNGGDGAISAVEGETGRPGGAGASQTLSTASGLFSAAKTITVQAGAGGQGNSANGGDAGNATLSILSGSSAFQRATTINILGGAGGSANGTGATGGLGGNSLLDVFTSGAFPAISNVNITGGNGGNGGTGAAGNGGKGGSARMTLINTGNLAAASTITLTSGDGGTNFAGRGGAGGDAILWIDTLDNSASNLTNVRFIPVDKKLAGAQGGSAILALNGNNLTIGGIDTNPGINSSGAIIRNGGLTDASLTVGGDNADHTFGGVLLDGSSGKLSLVKKGTGTLTVSNNGHQYTGGTTVAGGILLTTTQPLQANTVDPTLTGGGLIGLIGGGTLPNNLSIVGSGGIAATNSATTIVSGQIYGNGNLIVSGPGTVQVTNSNNSYAGGTTVTGGATLLIPNQNVLSTGGVTLDAGTLGFVSGTSGTLSRPITLGSGGGTLTALSANDMFSVASVISGSGGLTKAGPGTVTLTGANTYTGPTVVASGLLNVGTASVNSSLGNGTGAVTINSGATLALGNTSSTGSATITNSGGLQFWDSTTAGTAQITNNTGSTQHFMGSSTAGNATITNSGTIYFMANSTANNASIANNAGGVVDLSLHTGGISIGQLSGAGAVALGSNALTLGEKNTNDTISGVVRDGGYNGGTNGSLIKNGTGTVVLSGNNTYTGGTRVNSGVLGVGSDTALGSGRVLLNGGTLQASGSARTVNNAVTLASSSRLSSGTVSTSGAKVPGLTLTGAVTLGSEASLTVTGNTRVAISGVVGEDNIARTLTKDGVGTLVLTNDNIYTGGTLIRGGTLVVNNAYQRTAQGSGTGEGAVTVARGATLTGTYNISGAVQINNGGTISVGNSIGTSQVGSLALSGGSLLDFEIGDDGISSDRIEIAGLLSRTSPGPITFALSGEDIGGGIIKNISEGTFTLMTFGFQTGFVQSDFFATGLPSNWNSSFTLVQGGAQPGSLTVTLTQVGGNGSAAAPEPGTLALLLAAGSGAGFLFAFRTHRRSKSAANTAG